MYLRIGALHLYTGALTLSSGAVERSGACFVSSFDALVIYLVAMYHCNATLYWNADAMIS